MTLPELPTSRAPELPRPRLLGPVLQDASEEQVVMCLHIGRVRRDQLRARRADRQPDHPRHPGVGAGRAGPAVGPGVAQLPDLKLAWSEAGIGWIPFFLDRCDRHYANQRWLGHDFGDKLPSDVFREHSLACYVTDPTALKVRHDIGIDIIAWECDYPHSDSIWPDAPESVLAEMNAAGADDRRSTRSPGGTPAGSSAGTRSPGPRARRRPLRPCGPTRPTWTCRLDRAPSGRVAIQGKAAGEADVARRFSPLAR